MSKKHSSVKDKDYERMGRMLADIYETGHVSSSRAYKHAFIKGLFGGLGGVLGATLVLALLLWVLHFFTYVPLLGPVIRTINNTLEESR